jgi:hypothetical protein
VLSSLIRPRADEPDETTRRLNRQHERIAELEREQARLSPQVAALEERLAAPAGAPDSVPSPDGVDDAGDLLAQIRAEHARVRARITAAARYEERLRQLEDTVAALTRTGSDQERNR